MLRCRVGLAEEKKSLFQQGEMLSTKSFLYFCPPPPLNSSVLLAVIWPGFGLGRSVWTNGVYPCIQINKAFGFFFPIEQAVAICLEWITDEVFGCVVVGGMKFLKWGCTALCYIFWGKYQERSENRLSFWHNKQRRWTFDSSNPLEGVESSTFCRKWKQMYCFAQFQSCIWSLLCLIF